MCRSRIMLFDVKYFEFDHEIKFIRRAMLQRSLENCLEGKLTVEFCALFISWGSFPQLAAGGKPSTRFPPGRLVELIGMTKSKASIKRE